MKLSITEKIIIIGTDRPEQTMQVCIVCPDLSVQIFMLFSISSAFFGTLLHCITNLFYQFETLTIIISGAPLFRIFMLILFL